MSDKTWADELAEAGLAIAQSKHGQDAELTIEQALAALENIIMIVGDKRHRTWQGIHNVLERNGITFHDAFAATSAAAQGARPAPGSAGVLSVSRGDGTPGGGLMAYVRTEPKPDCDGSAEPQPAPGLPKVHAHPQDQAEEWLSETYEPDDANAVGYDRSDMIDAYHSGWDEHRKLAAAAIEREQPAPELAAATDETRGYRDALEHVRAIILEGDNSTEGSRLRRSRAVIRAALEGK